MSRHIVPIALLEQDLYKAVLTKQKTHRPLDHWILLSTSNAFNYFRSRRDEIRFAFDPHECVD